MIGGNASVEYRVATRVPLHNATVKNTSAMVRQVSGRIAEDRVDTGFSGEDTLIGSRGGGFSWTRANGAAADAIVAARAGARQSPR